MNDKEFLDRFGLKLHMLRKMNKMSQEDFANELYVDKSYYSKIERGEANPTLIYLKHIAEYYNMSLPELMDIKINI